jgi:O-antigen/teichoic acid export membrane protein
MKYVAVLTTIERCVLSGAGLLVLYLGLGLVALGVVYVLTYALVFAIGLTLFVHRYGAVSISFGGIELFPALRNALPFALAGLFSILYNRMDIYILTVYQSAAEVGWYNAAFRIIDAQLFLPMAIVSSLFPVLTRYYHSSPINFLHLYKRSFIVFLILGVTLSVITYVVTPPLIRLLYTDEYRMSGDILRTLSFMSTFCFLNLIVGNTLIAAGREELSTWTLVAGAVINAVVDFILIPRYHTHGAALARVFTELAAFVLQASFLIHVLRKQNLVWLPWARKVSTT